MAFSQTVADKVKRLGVMLGVYCSGVSGAHLNPAVTLANCIFRKFPWKKLPVYALAQLLGAMAASLIVYGNYKSAIDAFEGGQGIRTVGLDTSTAGIFCTYPAPFLTKTGQFFDEFIGSSILMFCLYALLDDGNNGAGNLTPLGLFFVIYGIGACFGSNTGYAINPARDLGPRIMSHAVGYGHQVWTAGDYYFWVCRFPPSHLTKLLTVDDRFPSSRHSWAVHSAASFTIRLSILVTVLSTPRIWASRDSLVSVLKRGEQRWCEIANTPTLTVWMHDKSTQLPLSSMGMSVNFLPRSSSHIY